MVLPSKYIKAKRDGKPHHSYFNAYIDGKTNGLASNGIQMGHMGTAKATGVFRHNVQELLDEGDLGHMGTAKATGVFRHNVQELLDEGDLRDQLKNLAVESIRDGWDGNVAEYEAELNDVAEALYSYRNFNKATTMTFGYGKEIQSFKSIGLRLHRSALPHTLLYSHPSHHEYSLLLGSSADPVDLPHLRVLERCV